MNIVIEFYREDNRIQFLTNKESLSQKEAEIVTTFVQLVEEQKSSFFRDFELIIDIADKAIKIREQDKERSFELPGYNLGNLMLSFAAFNRDFPFWIEDVDADIKELGCDLSFNPEDEDDE